MEVLIKHIFTKIEKSISEKGQPFKYGSLASSYSSFPNQRMVVLRGFNNNKITIYTDARSKKVAQFSTNPNASLLLFDNNSMEQVILKGVISIEKNKIENTWAKIPEFAHRDYTSVFAPGEPIDDKNAKYSNSEHHFCILQLMFTKIDYLKIDQPYNSRAIFKLNANNNWKGNYVVP